VGGVSLRGGCTHYGQHIAVLEAKCLDYDHVDDTQSFFERCLKIAFSLLIEPTAVSAMTLQRSLDNFVTSGRSSSRYEPHGPPFLEIAWLHSLKAPPRRASPHPGSSMGCPTPLILQAKLILSLGSGGNVRRGRYQVPLGNPGLELVEILLLTGRREITSMHSKYRTHRSGW
jgi:hypothetical protein